MTQWIQNYTPIGGSLSLSTLVAIIPILFLFWALAIKKLKGHIAALLTLLVTVLVVIIGYKMPVSLALSSTLYGALYGLWPVGWIVITAVFLYNLSVEAGQLEIIKNSVASLTNDRRLQTLLIAFCFGAFLEGAAGFGTPVAIAGAILIGIGFEPKYAAGLCLIANAAPVAFGALGIPIITASSITGINDLLISQVAAVQLTPLILIGPFYLVGLMGGFKAIKEVLPAILVIGISYAVLNWATAYYLGPMLPNIVASLGSMISLAIFLRFWQPAHTWRFPGEKEAIGKTKLQYTGKQIIKAWSPFLILTIIVAIWCIPWFKNLITEQLKWLIAFEWPGLYTAAGEAIIYKDATTPYPALYTWDFITSPGTAIFVSAIISCFALRIGPRKFFTVLGRTIKQLIFPLTNIMAVLGFAYVANYSGLSYTLGLAFASTGSIFPFLAPFLGWLAVFLTGSDTSAQALFSKLQQVTATQIGVNPVLTVAANSTGAVTGKMISPQSIAVASGATGLVGRESELFRFTFKHSLVFATIMGIVVYVQAYVFPSLIPIVAKLT